MMRQSAFRWMAAGAGASLAAAWISLSAPPLEAQQRRAVMAATSTYASLEGERAEIAFEASGPVPVIPVMINGKGPFRLGLDTGMPDTIAIRDIVAAALGLTPTGQVSIGDGSGNDRPIVPTYELQEVRIGGLTYREVESNGMRFPPGSRSTLDGIIGLTMFKELLLTVDYGSNRLVAKRGALPAPNGRDIVPTQPHPVGFVLVPVMIGSQTRHVMLDTGNRVGQLLLRPEEVRTLPTRGEPRETGVARTISSSARISAIDLDVPVRVGTTILPVTAVTYPSAAPMGNLGGLGLQGMQVILDQKNGRISVQRTRQP